MPGFAAAAPGSARGAASFITEAIAIARDTGCGGTIVVRMDSAYYSSSAVGAVRRAGAHDTRRTCASLLVALDVHPRVAMQILRHSQIAMTMEVYSEVPSAKTRSALKRLGRQLDG